MPSKTAKYKINTIILVAIRTSYLFKKFSSAIRKPPQRGAVKITIVNPPGMMFPPILLAFISYDGD
ncbi:hypothetical protein CE91St48_16170 [Emergencia timonensis]|nr:hypothetical protein CE91St48_16170 [Emergencia timonensis]